MFLQLDGWYGAGKGMLWTLLDSHPDVFCSPIHDYTFGAFIDQSDEHEWVRTKHFKVLRTALTRTRYNFFEQMFRDGFMSFEFSANDRLKLPYLIDFYKHDRLWMDKLHQMERWTLNKMTNALYESIWESHFKKNAEQAPPKWFASMGMAQYIDYYPQFPVIFPGAKSIAIRRKLENIVATRCNRKPREEDFTTRVHKFSSDFNSRIYEEKEVEGILSYYDKYDAMAEKFPDIFMIVDFDDVIRNTEAVMKKIADFIEVPFHPVLTKATYQGEELICNGKSYIQEEHDDVNRLLSKEELEIIRERKESYYAEKAGKNDGI